MRLFETILEANHRALAGDSRAGLNPAQFPESLPVVALTCIDPRLNRLLPDVLGIREEDFIWLRNAGNIVFDPLSSMMRSLALACAVKGGKEIAVIGHTDCRIRQISVNQLIESFRALGIQRSHLPDNLTEFFGLFASERQNVITGAGHIRRSPLISRQVPVHGWLLDVESGRLEWIVNGYETLGSALPPSPLFQKIEQAKEMVGALTSFHPSDLKVPEIKIGEWTLEPQKWISEVQTLKQNLQEALPGHQTPAAPPKVPPPMAQPVQGHQVSETPIPPPIRLIRNWVKPKK